MVTALYRQGDQQRRTTSWTSPGRCSAWLNMNGYLHLQYFNGYGETLLGYNRREDSQFRVGLSIVP